MADSGPLWMVIVAAVFTVFPPGPGSIAPVECGVSFGLLLVTELFLTRIAGERGALIVVAAALGCPLAIGAASGLTVASRPQM